MSVQQAFDVLSTIPEPLHPIYRMLTDKDADANLVHFVNSILDDNLDGSSFKRYFLPVRVVRKQLLQLLENWTPEAAEPLMIALNYAILAAFASRHQPKNVVH